MPGIKRDTINFQKFKDENNGMNGITKPKHKPELSICRWNIWYKIKINKTQRLAVITALRGFFDALPNTETSRRNFDPLLTIWLELITSIKSSEGCLSLLKMYILPI